MQNTQNGAAPAAGTYDNSAQQYTQGVQTQSNGKIKVSATVILLVVIAALQVVGLVLTINPPYLAQQNLTKQIVNEVAGKTEVNPFETPIISVVADADNLRSANTIQGEVYANAQNGDYVLGFSDKMVIYRQETGEIIYEGDSPGTILSKNQQTLSQSVLGAATARGFISADDQAVPQMSVVTEPEVLRKQDPAFYANAQKGDIIAIFPKKQLILLVRSTDNAGSQIIQSGNYNTAINAN